LIPIFNLYLSHLNPCLAQKNIVFFDFYDKEAALSTEFNYLFLVFDQPLCRGCAEQLAAFFTKYPFDSTTKVLLLTSFEPNIRSKRLKTSYFKSFFESKPDLFFIKYDDFRTVTDNTTDIRYPCILAISKHKLEYISYGSIFDDLNRMIISKKFFDNLFK
jgi:hypothetical protein